MNHNNINNLNTYAHLPNLFYKKASPQAMQNGRVILLNKDLAEELMLDSDWLIKQGILTGKSTLSDGSYLAQAYAGHQFGQFTMLGDGRAILLAEHLDQSGQLKDIQLKGAGKTAYGRAGDGLIPLRAALKEYMMSEAMHSLNIPTTRSLALATSDDQVYRNTVEQRGLLTRVASSHLRVGTFQFARVKGQLSDLQQLADYAIDRHYPELVNKHDKYLSFFKAVVKKQAELIANWQALGFVHGVMNTDNMAISGETIDYGPCAFLNHFNFQAVFSSIDTVGRYQYGNQPGIAQWNLTRFAEALLPLIDQNEDHAIDLLKQEIEQFLPLMNQAWTNLMRHKFGLSQAHENDTEFFYTFLNILQDNHLDYTNSFVQLLDETLSDKVSDANLESWLESWQSLIKKENQPKEQWQALMKASNPIIIPRHHLVESAIDEIILHQNFKSYNHLMEQLKNPFAYNEAQKEIYHQKVPIESFITYCGT